MVEIVKKRGYFFSLDALIALVLVLIVLSLVPTFYLKEKETAQQVYFSSDLVAALSTLRVGEIDDPYILSIINDSSESAKNRTIIEQILRLRVGGYSDRATELASAFMVNLTPDYYGTGIWVGNYDEAVLSSSGIPITQLISAKQMVSGIERDKAIEGLKARVFLTKIDERFSSTYLYFGGYIGEGKITQEFELPPNVEITSAYMELDINDDFDLYINDNYTYSFSPVNLNTSIDAWELNLSSLTLLHEGNNSITFVFNSSSERKYIGGGYFKVAYATPELGLFEKPGTKKKRLSGIEGAINIYDSFFVPGEINSMEIFMRLLTNAPSYLKIGNITIIDINSSSYEQNITLDSSYLSNLLNFSWISNKTVPIRMGLRNVSFAYGGTSDAVLITDRTGSMDSCDVDIDCASPGICDPYSPCNERRDRVAQNSDRVFINEMLEVSGNKVGLVGYGERASPVCSYYEITNDNSSLQNRIDDYYDEWCGYTCISCGIVSATELLVENKVLYNGVYKTDRDTTEHHVGDSGSVAVNETLELAVDKSRFIKAKLTVFGRSVDTEDGYKNCVFFNGHYLGRMCRSSDDGSTGWHTCSFPLEEEFLHSSGEYETSWVITSEAEFQSCSLSNTDSSSYPGNVTLLADWWNSAWSKRRKLTFNNIGQSEDMQNFPVLVVLNSGRIDYSETQNSGQDIRFVDRDGTVLSHEIENWDESGNSYVWVNVPQIDGSSNSDYVWMYYGNPSASDGQDVQNVWDSDFIAVWHMDSNQDSTGYNNDMTCSNCPSSTTGYIDGSYNYDGNNDYNSVGNSDEINEGGPWDDKTVEVWFRADTIDSGSTKDIIYEQGGTVRGLNIYANNNNIYVGGWNKDFGQSNWDPGTWLNTAISTGRGYYIVLRLKDGTHSACTECFKGFLNGQEFGNGDGRRLYAHTGDIRIGFGDTLMHDGTNGEEEFDGVIDELRLSNNARPDDWIKAQYLSLNDSFVTYSSEMVQGGTVYADSGTIVSPVYDTRGNSTWLNISWSESLPTGTDIYFEIRTGNTASPDGSWNNYDLSDAVYSNPEGEVILQSNGRYVQWTANLSTTNTNITPVLMNVEIGYIAVDSGENIVTITGANTIGCFDTAGEQDDWDFKDVMLMAWESDSTMNKESFFNATESQIGDPALPQSITRSFSTGIDISKIKSAYLVFEALDVNPSYYDCVYVNGNYIGAVDYQKWSGDNVWQNITFDVPVMAINSSNIAIRFVAGTTYGCLERYDLDNDEWRFRNVNLTVYWSNEADSYDRFMSMLVMSDGNANTKIGTRRNYDTSGAATEAITKACEAFSRFGISIYSVAFGDGADEDLMEDIACCDDCDNYYNAANAEELLDIYSEIANEIIQFQFSAQTANITGNVSSTIYPDSYFFFNYSPPIATTTSYGFIPLTVESPRFNNMITNGSFYVPPGVEVYDAKLLSYSGDKWTDRAMIKDGAGDWITFYNLSEYSAIYQEMGDPYMVQIPINLILIGTDNEVLISTGIGPFNSTGGSFDDRAVYTIGVDFYSDYIGTISDKAEGCLWQLNYVDGTNNSILIPFDYDGTESCEFTASTECESDYDDDAINSAVCELLDHIDFNDNGLLLVKLDQDSIQTDIISIGGIPYMWGPTIMEVRVWN